MNYKHREIDELPRLSAFFSLFALLFCAAATQAFSAERFSITVGGESGWGSLESAETLQETKGRFSLPALGIAPGIGEQGQADTDLYLSFDSPAPLDEAGNYIIMASRSFFSGKERARQGEGAAIFNTDGEGISLRGRASAIFARRGVLPSFTISFWLYPSAVENGSVVFSWRSQLVPKGGLNPVYQGIKASFEQSRLVWDFSNVWLAESGEPLSARLAPDRMTIPGKWSFHQLSYDADSGFLEYRIDGRTEASVCVKKLAGNGRASVAGFISGDADIEIAPKYSGLMDEFRIERQPLAAVNVEGLRELAGFYPAAGGRFTTAPLDTGRGEARLLSADISIIEPEGTESEFYVRGGNNFHEWTESYPAWIPLANGKPAEAISGQYFQIAGGLYPDASRGKTPLLTWISLNLEKRNEPWPPLKVRGEAGSGNVRISWTPPADSSARGYLVYFGEGHGEYLSQGSPIDVGNSLSCVISGLENGKMYYFAVASYGDAGAAFPGALSPEVAARPLATRELQER